MARIFHASDLHFGAEDREALDWFAACVASERPDAVAITGDLTMRARHSEFAACCEWILSLDVPVTVEVGNHDLPYFNLIERFTTPYKRIHKIERLIEREIDLPGISLIPLKTTARAQARLNWSKGVVTSAALKKSVAAISVLPPAQLILVTAHHPLVEANTKGTALTKGGNRALAALAKAGVHAVLTGHVHDPFDLVAQTPHGPIRMIGAGTLSERVRSTPPSFNELAIADYAVAVTVRTLGDVPTPAMMIDDIPEDASPPGPGDAVAAVGQDRA
jgi:3',5'-cyclic AMP phosphodiesterase CpdA